MSKPFNFLPARKVSFLKKHMESEGYPTFGIPKFRKSPTNAAQRRDWGRVFPRVAWVWKVSFPTR